MAGPWGRQNQLIGSTQVRGLKDQGEKQIATAQTETAKSSRPLPCVTESTPVAKEFLCSPRNQPKIDFLRLCKLTDIQETAGLPIQRRG